MRHGVRKDYLKGSRRNGRGHSPYPFDRLLESRLGRPWDDVFSELCAEFDNRSLAGYSFRRDLKWHVATNCWIGAETGTIYGGSYGSNESAVSNEFYVHPWTGLLCWAPPVVHDRREQEVTIILEGGAKDKTEAISYLEKTDGIWYRHQITRRWMEKDIWGREYERTVTEKKQLGKKELRVLGLRNSGPSEFIGRCVKCGAHCTATGGCIHAVKGIQ
jgi:hypothetical protein